MEKLIEKEESFRQCIQKLSGLIIAMTVNLPSEYADECIKEMQNCLREIK
jgi:hypothetical protein